ncbi:MAG: cytochrome b/b6 domain-containing protein [Acidobacteria bacterium]|nr:cytochrome b/b6 domain-containing protein [Acidobacteriota bacterium]
MDFLRWGRSPWGEEILIRISWDLLYLSAIGGVLFLIGHALYVRFWPQPAAEKEDAAKLAGLAVRLPDKVARHSLAARAFHWVMAGAMFVLLFTAFLPIIGVQFAWVTIHWIAGVILTLSIIYHTIHATFWLDFWSIWPEKGDVEDTRRRMLRSAGQAAPPPRKHGKYPLENKLYHLIILITSVAVIGTGIFMMKRVQTGFLVRDPYIFSDAAWGVMYVLHGLTGVGLVALVMAHVYFAIRPEKLWITYSMIFGWIDRRHYLEHHDPQRWNVALPAPPPPPDADAAPGRKVAV